MNIIQWQLIPKFECHTGGFKKCFWILVMMGMAAALMYNVVQLTRKYFDHPISVTLSVGHQQQLTFPSVTVCNMSPIKKSAWAAAQNTQVKRRRKRAIGIRQFLIFCRYNKFIPPEWQLLFSYLKNTIIIAYSYSTLNLNRGVHFKHLFTINIQNFETWNFETKKNKYI